MNKRCPVYVDGLLVDGLCGLRWSRLSYSFCRWGARLPPAECQWPSKISGFWPLTERSFFFGGGLMEASAKGLTLWEISDFPQWDTA